MTWGAVAVIGAAVIGGVAQDRAADKAADAQKRTGDAAIDAQIAAREQARNDLMPYSQFGQQGIGLFNQLSNGDYSGFMDSPDFKAANKFGLQNLDHSAASRGGLFGGGHTRDTIGFSQDLASQYLGNYRNSLFQQIGMGQNAAAGQGGFSMNAGNNISGQYNNQGLAAANSALRQGENYAQIAGALGGAFANYAGNRQSSYQPQSGYGPFQPNQSGYQSPNYVGYDGSSAFGKWGQGWDS